MNTVPKKMGKMLAYVEELSDLKGKCFTSKVTKGAIEMILCAKHKKDCMSTKKLESHQMFRNNSTFIFSAIETSFDECKKINRRKREFLGSILTIMF